MKPRHKHIVGFIGLIISVYLIYALFTARSGCIVGQIIRDARHMSRYGEMHGNQWSGNLIEGFYLVLVQKNINDVEHYGVFKKNEYDHYLKVGGGYSVSANGAEVRSEKDVMLKDKGERWRLTFFTLDQSGFVEIRTNGDLAKFVDGRKIRIIRIVK